MSRKKGKGSASTAVPWFVYVFIRIQPKHFHLEWKLYPAIKLSTVTLDKERKFNLFLLVEVWTRLSFWIIVKHRCISVSQHLWTRDRNNTKAVLQQPCKLFLSGLWTIGSLSHRFRKPQETLCTSTSKTSKFVNDKRIGHLTLFDPVPL